MPGQALWHKLLAALPTIKEYLHRLDACIEANAETNLIKQLASEIITGTKCDFINLLWSYLI